ncbi:MAG: hypothetical protein JO228_00885, partial [Xanthobacteraceae bacterium]|nr:hypothetical protein [Xanthobacteraceae bacterium]
MVELEHVDEAHRHLAVERLAGAAVMQRHLARMVEPGEIEALDSEELVELAGNLKNGVPMASPVFDGAREDDIVQMLTEAGLASSGQVTLVDGRTGDA